MQDLQSLNIKFMSVRKIAALASIILVISAIISLATKQLALGLDFTGGTVIELSAPKPVVLSELNNILIQNGFERSLTQHFGSASDVLIRIPPKKNNPANATNDVDHFANLLKNDKFFTDYTLKRIEMLGPQVGEELRDQSGVALLFALGCMLLYISFRFQLKFAVAAVVALLHDVIITLGIFSLCSITFDLTVLAAVLAVIGYSLNDSIVVSDRIRENFRSTQLDDSSEIINISLNHTLSRTLVTSATTLFVLSSLLFLGGSLLKGFTIALIIGVLVGTYSSIYIVPNILLLLNIKRDDFLQKIKEDQSLEDIP